MKRQTMTTHSLLKQQGMHAVIFLSVSHFHEILITRFFAIPSSFRVQFYDILRFRKGKKRDNPLKEKYKSSFICSTLFCISGYISKYLNV